MSYVIYRQKVTLLRPFLPLQLVSSNFLPKQSINMENGFNELKISLKSGLTQGESIGQCAIPTYYFVCVECVKHEGTLSSLPLSFPRLLFSGLLDKAEGSPALCTWLWSGRS